MIKVLFVCHGWVNTFVTVHAVSFHYSQQGSLHA